MKKIAVVEVMDLEGDIFGSSFLFETALDKAEDLIEICFENIVEWVSFRIVEEYIPTAKQLNMAIGLRGFENNYTHSWTNSPRCW